MSGTPADSNMLNVNSHIAHDIPRSRSFPVTPPDSIGNVRTAWSTFKKSQSGPAQPVVKSLFVGCQTFLVCIAIVSPIILAFGLAELDGIDVSIWPWVGLFGFPTLAAAMATYVAYPRFEYTYLGNQGFAFIKASGSPTNITHRDIVHFDDQSLALYLRFRSKPSEKVAGVSIRETDLDACWLDKTGKIRTRFRDGGVDVRVLARVMQGKIDSDPHIARYLALPNRDEQSEIFWNEDGVNDCSFRILAIREWISAHRARMLRELQDGHSLEFEIVEQFPAASEEESLGEIGNISDIESLLKRRNDSLQADRITVTRRGLLVHNSSGVHSISPEEVSELNIDQLSFSIELLANEAIPLESGTRAKRVLLFAGCVSNLASLIASIEEVCQCSLVDKRPEKIKRVLPLSENMQHAIHPY